MPEPARPAIAVPHPVLVRSGARLGLRRHWPLGALIFALLAPLQASAQLRASGDYLQRMDRDGDGRVSLAEYQAWMGYAFERMDRDGDGILTPAELPGGRGRTIDLAEHRAALAAAFRRQDRNADGVLDARELAAPPQ